MTDAWLVIVNERQATAAALFAGLFCAAAFLGAFGAWAIYVITALTAARFLLWHPPSRGHAAVGVGVAVFLVARTLEYFVGDGAADYAYLIAYLPLLVGAGFVLRSRAPRLEPEIVSEAVGVAIPTALVVSEVFDRWGDADELLGAALVVIAFLLAIVLGLSSIGRAPSPTMRWWLLAGLLGMSAEVIDGSQEAGAMAADLVAAACFVPLVLASLGDDQRDFLRESRVGVRRTFGRLQLVSSAVLVSLPVALVATGAAGWTRDNLLLLTFAAFGSLTNGVVRARLLVKLRDWSFAREQELSQFSAELVSLDAGGQLGAVIRVMKRFIDGNGVVAIIDAEDRLVIRADTGCAVPAQTTWNDCAQRFEHEIVAVVPDESGWALALASPVTLRPELQSLLESVAAQLALATQTHRVREAAHRERADRRFRALVQDSGDVVFVVDATTLRTRVAGPTLTRLLGHDDDSYVGRSVLQHVHDDDRPAIEAALASEQPAELPSFEVRVRHRDGHFHWFALNVRDLTTEPEIGGLVVSLTDVHQRKTAELQLRSAEARYRTMVARSTEIFVVIEAGGTMSYVSPNITGVLGYEPSDLIGHDVRTLLTEQGLASRRVFIDQLGNDLAGSSVELEVHHQSGEPRLVEIMLADWDTIEQGSLLLIVRDVTNRRELEASLRSRALHDQLTGLLNRSSFNHGLQGALQSLAVGHELGVVHLDLNDFKPINDTLGFKAGDQLLIDVATRLRSRLRADDVIARLGADEFAVIVEGTSPEDVLHFAHRLLSIFDEPFIVGGRPQHITASAGLITTSSRRTDARRLLENVALTVGRASKSDTGERLVVFEEWMRTAAAEQFELAADISIALERGEFSLVYQPILDLASQRVVSVEALMRWHHPKRGPISPGLFIPIAERSGSVVPLGRLAIRQACEQLAYWHEHQPGARRLSVSVNVSARQLERPGEAEILMEIVRSTGLDPSSLTLELTESTMLNDAHWIREQLEAFRAMGVKIAVDDFGTGAAGLNHLRDVPFDVLKVDRSYVDRLESSTEATELVGAVIDLAHRLQAKVVAEGIENPAQAAILNDLGCDNGQGFYLGRPMDVERIEKWFEDGRDGSVASLVDAGADTPHRPPAGQ